MSDEWPWWMGVNAEIYFNESRFHDLLNELRVPLLRERTRETSTAAEAGAEGGVLGFVTAKSKLGRKNADASTEIVTESMTISEVYEKAVSLRPPRIVRVMEPGDWDYVAAPMFVHGQGNMKLVSERPDEFDLKGVVHHIEGEVAGRTISLSFSSNHVRSNSYTTYLFGEGEEEVTFLGRLTSTPKAAEKIKIRPILIGSPVS